MVSMLLLLPTKGQGSDDGKFIGTNVLNEAFFGKISITFSRVIQNLPLRKKSLLTL